MFMVMFVIVGDSHSRRLILNSVTTSMNCLTRSKRKLTRKSKIWILWSELLEQKLALTVFSERVLSVLGVAGEE